MSPSGSEVEALHRVELAREHLHRAYGHLLAFHHSVGHAMDRLDGVEDDLRASGREQFADELRTDHLPAGVFEGCWSYELVEAFESGFLADVDDFERRVRREVTDGRRHAAERAQQRRWRERAER
ncbi:MAG: hypothetical protein ABEJ61_01645 [Haloferacaceae archaeon]